MIDLFIRFFILFISIYIFNYNIRYDTDDNGDIGGMFSLLNVNLFLIIIIIMTLYSIIELIYFT